MKNKLLLFIFVFLLIGFLSFNLVSADYKFQDAQEENSGGGYILNEIIRFMNLNVLEKGDVSNTFVAYLDEDLLNGHDASFFGGEILSISSGDVPLPMHKALKYAGDYAAVYHSSVDCNGNSRGCASGWGIIQWTCQRFLRCSDNAHLWSCNVPICALAS
jgi:hypothetical protein